MLQKSLFILLSFHFIILNASRLPFNIRVLQEKAPTPLESVSFSSQIIDNLSNLVITLTYPVILQEGVESTIKLQKNEQDGEEIDAKNYFTFENKEKVQTLSYKEPVSEHLQFGLYKLSTITSNNTSYSIPPTSPSLFCYTPCYILTNTSEVINMNKEDNDKTSFIVYLQGDCEEALSKQNLIKIKLVNEDVQGIPECKVKNNDKLNKTYLHCNITENITRSTDKDKPFKYDLKYQTNLCKTKSDYYFDTKISVSLVSSYYVFLNKIYILLFLLYIL